MPIRQQSPSPSRQSRTQTKHTHNTQAQRTRSSSGPRSTIQCYTCHKLSHTGNECYSQAICGICQYQGHIESVCRNPPWCVYHQKIGHKTRDCRRGPVGPYVNFHQAPNQYGGGLPCNQQAGHRMCSPHTRSHFGHTNAHEKLLGNVLVPTLETLTKISRP